MEQKGKLGTVAEYDVKVSDQGVATVSLSIDLIEQLQALVQGKEESFLGRLVGFVSGKVRPVAASGQDVAVSDAPAVLPAEVKPTIG